MRKVDNLTRNISNGVRAMNAIMGDMGMFQPPNFVDGEATVIEDNTSESVKEDSSSNESLPYNRFIKTAVLYNMYFSVDHDPMVATLVFICRDNDDKLFVLNRNYVLDNTDDVEILKCLPFAEDKNTDFAGRLIGNHIISTYLDSYITDLNFNVQKGFETELDPVLLLDAIDLKSDSSIKLGVSAEVFACMSFIDRYIIEDLMNDHDLQLATVVCSKEPENPLQFFVIDSISSIISMAPVYKKKKKLFAKKEKTNTIGLVAKVNRFLSKDEKETVSILIPLDIGTTYPDEKFKGKTIENIQNAYYGESDQYVSTLLIPDIKIFGEVEKHYMMIRGKNKDKVVRLFLLDTSVVEDLENKIKEF